MKKRAPILILLALLVVFSCMQEREPVPNPAAGAKDVPRIYFIAKSEQNHGPALGFELYRGPESAMGNPVPGPRALLYALLAGPQQENLRSPFPKGLTLEGWRWDPDVEGNLQVRMSEQYSGLADISLTLADYCIVMTLSQLPGVETVEITSGGYAAAYRSHQILSAEEVVLTDDLAVPGSGRLPDSTLP